MLFTNSFFRIAMRYNKTNRGWSYRSGVGHF